MAITFACDSCGSKFSVEPRLAGRSAKCKICGNKMTIPQVTAAKALAAATAPGVALGPGGRPMNWLDAVSQVGFKPITAEGMAAVRRPLKPSPLDDASFSGLYQVADAPSSLAVEKPSGRAAGPLVRGYRNTLLHPQRLFRMLNEWAFVLSAPFLGILLLAIAIRNRPLAVFAATIVVLLNIGRLVAGLANLIIIPFRDSPVQGVIFLLFPLTLIYLTQNWNRVRKPVQRVLGPVVTIALVVLAFAFVPWLAKGGPAGGSVADRLKSGAGALKGEIKGQLDKTGVDQLETKARDAIQGLEKRASNLNPGG